MSLSRRQFVQVFGLSAATLGVLGVAGCSGGNGGSGSAAADGSKIQTIKDRGVLNCGVKADVIGYGYMDTATQEYEGLEIDLCYQIAAAVFEVSYEEAREQELCAFTTVTPTTRGTLIDSGQLDIVAATYTITPEREEDWDFSTPYRTDSVGIMVKKANGWTSMEDLDGQTIGVSTGSTTQQLVTQMIADEGFACTPNFVEYQSYPEIKDALDAGMVQAFAMDRSTLNTYMDDTVELLQPEVEFGTQDYGVATQKGSDLSELVDKTVVETWLGASA